MRMIVVSGLSGSGKSIALQTLEDVGYYCVDNLPITLLKSFAGEILRHGQPLPHTTAIGIDARNFLGELDRFPAIIEELRGSGLKVEIVFLQAADEVLLKRYSETRRKHPLSLEDVPLLEAIRQERQLLACISAYADLIIDTSLTNVHELRRLLRQRLHEPTAAFQSCSNPSALKRERRPMPILSSMYAVCPIRIGNRNCAPSPGWTRRLSAF